jgi:hypothetical protein
MEEERVYRLQEGSEWVERAGEHAPVDARADVPGRRPSLTSLLVEAGVASEQGIREALEEGTRTGEKLGEVVVRRGWASEDQLAQLLAKQWQLPFMGADALTVDPAALRRLPADQAHSLAALPVGFDNQAIVVAVAEPSEHRLAALTDLLGQASFLVVARSELEQLLAALPESPAESEELPPPADRVTARTQPAPADRTDADTSTDNPPHNDDVATNPDAFGGEPDAVASLSERLQSIQAEIQQLERALQQALTTVAAQQQELDQARATHLRDTDTIRRLDARLNENGDLFTTLRDRVEELRQTLKTR